MAPIENTINEGLNSNIDRSQNKWHHLIQQANFTLFFFLSHSVINNTYLCIGILRHNP